MILKISGAEKITDKVIEEKDSKNNNTKDNKQASPVQSGMVKKVTDLKSR